MIETFSALAEPNRLRIVELLRAGAHPVGDIADKLHLQQPQVSKHLRVLKEAGLVDVEVRAQQRVYELRAEPLQDLDRWLDRFRAMWDAQLDRLDDYVQKMKRERATKQKPDKKK